MPEVPLSSKQPHTMAGIGSDPLQEDPLLELFRAERDAIAFLGLLSHLYLFPQASPVPPLAITQALIGDSSAKTAKHITPMQAGPFIQAAVIDNMDGEVLSLEANAVHASNDPLQHAEQRAIRSALERLHAKRPRDAEMSVKEYFETQLFYHPGSATADFLHRGCTLYTSLEPCPMCSSTLLVCRMKRTAFLVPDFSYGGAWQPLKDTYYADAALCCEALTVPQTNSTESASVSLPSWLSASVELRQRLLRRFAEARGQGIRDALLFNAVYGELSEVWDTFGSITPSHLVTQNLDREKNLKTLRDFQQDCQVS